MKDRVDVAHLVPADRFREDTSRESKRFTSHTITKQTTSTLPGQTPRPATPNTYRRLIQVRSAAAFVLILVGVSIVTLVHDDEVCESFGFHLFVGNQLLSCLHGDLTLLLWVLRD